MLTEYLVLSLEQAFDSTHQRTTLACEVGCSLTLEGGLEQIAGADANTESDGTLLCFSCGVLIDGIRAVESASFKEHGTERSARTLWCHQDDVDILWRYDSSAVVPVNGEAMGVIQSLASGEVRFDARPHLNLSCIGKEHADDGTLLGSLFDGEERLSRHPSVGHGFLVGLAFTLSDNHIEPIVAQVASLARSLDAIADDGDGLVFQYLTCFLQGKLLAGDHSLEYATEIHFSHILNTFFRGTRPLVCW